MTKTDLFIVALMKVEARLLSLNQLRRGKTEQIREFLNLNFNTYSIPSFSLLTKIKTVILENPNLELQGGGEPAIIGMGAVIATTKYDAVGAVVLQLPMRPKRIIAALQQV